MREFKSNNWEISIDSTIFIRNHLHYFDEKLTKSGGCFQCHMLSIFSDLNSSLLKLLHFCCLQPVLISHFHNKSSIFSYRSFLLSNVYHLLSPVCMLLLPCALLHWKSVANFQCPIASSYNIHNLLQKLGTALDSYQLLINDKWQQYVLLKLQLFFHWNCKCE